MTPKYAYWVFPISKAVSIMLRITAYHGNECEAEYNSYKNNFPSTKPKLCLSVVLHCEDIDGSVYRIVRLFLAKWVGMNALLTYAYATIHPAHTAPTGISSRQNDKTRLTATISKGILIA